MAVRIRLYRKGRKNSPFYRVVAMDSRTKRDGKYLENLGTYSPREKDDEKKLILKKDRIKYWLKNGAQPTEKMRAILKKEKISIK